MVAETVVSSPNEVAITSIPASTGTRAPILTESWAPATLPMIAATASGTNARPALTGE